MGQQFAEKCIFSDTIVLLMYKSHRTLFTIELQVLVYFGGCNKRCYLWKVLKIALEEQVRKSPQDSRLCALYVVEFDSIHLYLSSFCFNQNCQNCDSQKATATTGSHRINCLLFATSYLVLFCITFFLMGCKLQWSRSELSSIVIQYIVWCFDSKLLCPLFI